MPLSCHLYPCRSDNYGVLVRDTASGAVAIIDVPEEMATRAAIQDTGWTPTHILLTHHHHDHIEGVGGIRSSFPVSVVGNGADAHRLPRLDQEVGGGDTFMLGDSAIDVLDVPGHTIGHIAFVSTSNKLAFVGDTLLALGCGRLFEGTPEQMFESLSKLASLDPDTMIYSGHEYTQANLKFAQSVDPHNEALQKRGQTINAQRARNEPTVPAKLCDELATNPFLRAPDAASFAKVRAAKDDF